MTHDEILRDLNTLLATYEQVANRLAEIDAFDDEFWPMMRELSAIRTKFEALMVTAIAPVDRWFAAWDEYHASNNCALQSSDVE